MPNAFPYFGHALGSLSRDLQLNVVYEQAVPEKFQAVHRQLTPKEVRADAF